MSVARRCIATSWSTIRKRNVNTLMATINENIDLSFRAKRYHSLPFLRCILSICVKEFRVLSWRECSIFLSAFSCAARERANSECTNATFWGLVRFIGKIRKVKHGMAEETTTAAKRLRLRRAATELSLESETLRIIAEELRQLKEERR